MPYTFDALLPTAERFASLKFRRVAWRLSYKHLDWYDALELVAFVQAIGLPYARYIFHWRGLASVRAYGYLRKHVGAEADAYIHANLSAFSLDDGLAVLKAMKDGGWSRGKVPQIVSDALRESRKRGNTIAEIARGTGLTREQVKTICKVRTKADLRVKAAAYGALGL